MDSPSMKFEKKWAFSHPNSLTTSKGVTETSPALKWKGEIQESFVKEFPQNGTTGKRLENVAPETEVTVAPKGNVAKEDQDGTRALIAYLEEQMERAQNKPKPPITPIQRLDLKALARQMEAVPSPQTDCEDESETDEIEEVPSPQTDHEDKSETDIRKPPITTIRPLDLKALAREMERVPSPQTDLEDDSEEDCEDESDIKFEREKTEMTYLEHMDTILEESVTDAKITLSSESPPFIIQPSRIADKEKNHRTDMEKLVRKTIPQEVPEKRVDHIPNHQAHGIIETPHKIQFSVIPSYIKTPIRPVQRQMPPITALGDDVDVLQSTMDENFHLGCKKLFVNNDQYYVLKKLGLGGSSEVFQCLNVKNKALRAIKVVSLHDASTANRFVNEVKTLKLLQSSRHVIRLFDYEISKATDTLLVVLEAGGSDLSKVLKEYAQSSSHLPTYMLLAYWMDILYAVREIHSLRIIHSDLKPANFVRTETGLKIIDFGISTQVQLNMSAVFKPVAEGSINYISPEALLEENSTNENSPNFGRVKYRIGFKSDIWSLGCVLYQMVYGKTPFHQYTSLEEKMRRIINPNYTIEYPNVNWVPSKIIATIRKCLQYEMRLRPSVDDLIAEYEGAFLNM